MATRTRLATPARFLALLVLLGALGACGPEPATPADDDRAEGPVATGSDASEEPGEEPSEEPPSPSEPAEPTADAGGTGALADALLPAEEVPGFNDQFTWKEQATDTKEPRDLGGTCHQFELTSIGAEEVAYRTYLPTQGDGSVASELVAQFPDEMTATRAFEVLKSWREECGRSLEKFDSAQVGDLEDVDTDAGEGHWYLLTYGPADGDPEAGYFDAQGLVKVGNRIAVVRLNLIGQDYNYEVGQEPMVGGVRAAAERLA